MGLSAIVILLPLMLVWYRHPETFWGRYSAMGIFPSGWLDEQVQQTGQNAIMILLDRTRRAFLNFIALPDLGGFYNTGQPLLDRFSAVLAIFGFADAVYRIRQKEYLLFVVWFVLAVIAGGVLVLEEAGSARLTTTAIPLMFFSGLGLARLAEIFKSVLVFSLRTERILIGASVAALVLLGIRFYFVDYTPRRSYGYDGTWMFTEMARYLKAQPGEYRAYFFGAPFAFIGHGTVRYIAPDIDGMDVKDQINGPPDFVDPDLRAIFIFYPPRAGELQYVEAAYPNGKESAITKPNGEKLLYLYTVDKPGEQNAVPK
jgi:hypothetical protein